MNAQSKTRKRLVTLTALIALGVMTSSVTGCKSVSTATDFCYLYKPVYTSRQDTPETIEQVTDNNVAWVELCE